MRDWWPAGCAWPDGPLRTRRAPRVSYSLPQDCHGWDSCDLSDCREQWGGQRTFPDAETPVPRPLPRLPRPGRPALVALAALSLLVAAAPLRAARLRGHPGRHVVGVADGRSGGLAQSRPGHRRDGRRDRPGGRGRTGPGRRTSYRRRGRRALRGLRRRALLPGPGLDRRVRGGREPAVGGSRRRGPGHGTAERTGDLDAAGMLARRQQQTPAERAAADRRELTAAARAVDKVMELRARDPGPWRCPTAPRRAGQAGHARTPGASPSSTSRPEPRSTQNKTYWCGPATAAGDRAGAGASAARTSAYWARRLGTTIGRHRDHRPWCAS